MIATGLLAASMLNEPALYQHLDVALYRFGRYSRLRLDTRDFQTGIGFDAVENLQLPFIQSTVISTVPFVISTLWLVISTLWRDPSTMLGMTEEGLGMTGESLAFPRFLSRIAKYRFRNRSDSLISRPSAI